MKPAFQVIIAPIVCGPIVPPRRKFRLTIYPDGARDQLVKKCVFLNQSPNCRTESQAPKFGY